MKKFRFQAGTIAMLLLLLPGTARSQEARHGGILDWIMGLSGPGFRRVGLYLAFDLDSRPSWVTSDRGVELSIAGLTSVEVKNRGKVTPPDAKLKLYSVQLTGTIPILNLPIGEGLEVGGGYSYHLFLSELPAAQGGAQGFFSHYSIPVFGQIPFSFRRASIIPGGGWHRFAGFDDDAFQPVDVEVERSAEWAPFLFVMVELKF